MPGHRSVVEPLWVRPHSGEPYPVVCSDDVAAALRTVWAGWRQAVIVADDTTLGLFGHSVGRALEGLDCDVLRLSFPPGEAQKTRAQKARLEDAMLAAGVDRGACVVALGGGIPLDLAGFVAATYLRGIAHVNVATTLLAQVDAAVGGKTAVNTAHGKNLVGAFHHPRAVILDRGALGSLAARELRSGLAEAVKHAVLADAALFERFEAWEAGEESATLVPPAETIVRCVEIKAAVVAEDDRDRGRRNVLNFGHTVAHAIEHATRHRTPHGHAVAIGMVVESFLAPGFPAGERVRLARLLSRLGLPTRPPCSFAEAAPFLSRDKKTLAGQVRCALPSRIGHIEAEAGSWVRTVTLAELERAWGAGGLDDALSDR